MSFRLIVAAFFAGLGLAIMEGFELLERGHFLSGRDAGELWGICFVLILIALLLADHEEAASNSKNHGL